MSNKKLQYHILVFGCQMNFSDGEKLEKILIDLGYKKSPDEDSADIIAVVACSIRKSAIDRVYGKAHIWKKRRRSGKLKTILAGCVLDYDKKKLSSLFDFVVDIKDLAQLKKILSGTKATTRRKSYLSLPGEMNSNFQASVPIMTGCNNFCSYCVVPYTRGREKSRPAKAIVEECQKLIKKGYKEIFLLGQNVNSYQSGKYSFPQLLKKVDEIKALPAEASLGAKEEDFWLRFSTSHPKDLSDNLLAVMKNGKHITPYLHLAVQSGDDKILEAMNRKYTVKHFLEIIAKARKAMPEVMISTDVIVGFPGESKKQFENTIKLFKKAEFDMAYISEFSPRKGTVAGKLKDDVSKIEKSKRKEELNELLKKTALKHNQKYIGRTVKVLVEKFKSGQCLGKTDTYKTVVFFGDKKLVGEFVEVKINKVGSWVLYG
ncbi:MAG: tRNA (N6-isopentenyl adenosine(37)-C2)-methylthiotransferase MiaB [Patescibacteria group bacterium]